MANKVKKLTAEQLVRLIREEKAKFGKEKELDSVKADEVEADEYADTLEKKVDHLKGLKEEEQKLLKRLRSIHEAKRKAIREI